MTPAQARRHRRRQPRIAWPVAALAVAAVASGVVTAVRGDGADRGGDPLERVRSMPVASATTPDTISAGPSGYRITYMIRRRLQKPQSETVSVLRPYLSRREGPTEVQETDFARLAIRPHSGFPVVVTPPPAAVDARPHLVVERAVEEGLLQRREQREVAGRRCQVYRGENGVAAATISAPLPRKFTDVCVGGDGLVLEEWQVIDGEAVSQRVATRVDAAAPAAQQLDTTIDGGPTIDAARGGGSVLPVDPASEPQGRFFVLPAPPAGFTLRGRYSVVPPQPGLGPSGGEAPASPIASTADVYERGSDVLIVDRGGTQNLSAAFAPRPEGRPADLGPVLGEGELLLTWNGPEARVALADGKFVRVYGTVAIELAVATARALVETPGGPGLVFLTR